MSQEEKQIIEKIYSWLISKEAQIAKSGMQTDWVNGYFEAIDDVAKYIKSLDK